MRKNCKTFEQWVRSQYDEFQKTQMNSCNERFANNHLGMNVYTNSVNDGSVRCFIYNERRNKTGTASVKAANWDDPTMIAVGLAWADYKGESIPNFTVPLYSLGTCDRFYYNGCEFVYLTSNPYKLNCVIVCDADGVPYNFDKETRVRVKE